MPEIDLPDGVWDVAIAAKEAVRYTDHPDNYQAVYGMSSYALRAVIAAAWAAGRESAYTTDKIEWGMRRADDGRVLKAWDEDDARTSVAHNPQLSLRRRRVGPWEEVSDADS